MNPIPAAFQITEPFIQDTYLVNGELKKWTGQTHPVFSTISSTEKYSPTILGSIPAMGAAEADEVVASAVAAYDNGQGLWPTMKVADRIKCMENFAGQMRATRTEVVKWLMWEIGTSGGTPETEMETFRMGLSLARSSAVYIGYGREYIYLGRGKANEDERAVVSPKTTRET